MALTLTEKSNIRRYLGVSDLTQQAYSTLEGALAGVSAEGEVQIRAMLVNLGLLEGRMATAWGQIGVIRAEEVTLAGGDQLLWFRSEAARIVCMLASTLGVEVQMDVFNGGGARSGRAGRA